MSTGFKAMVFALALAAGAGVAYADGGGVKLDGAQEVPAVASDAHGVADIAVGADGSIIGTIKTTGIVGTMAHVHWAAAGKNGPVVITLTKSGADQWSIPAGAKLTAEQLAGYRAGELYVNVHSDAHKGGEIRAQLKP